MKTHLYCIPCLARQVFDAASMATEDESLQEEILRRGLHQIADTLLDESPPRIATEIHRMVREMSGNPDPYAALKREFNEKALAMLPELRARVEGASDPLEAAVRLAIAGNIIDFGVAGHDGSVCLHETIERCLVQPFGIDHLEAVRARLAEATKILYLADNTGEIVFDIPLLKQLGAERVTVAVKQSPVLNDATMDDARVCGLPEIVTVIDNGTAVPGTILPLCSDTFRQCFHEADLIISKGQGNFETLDDNAHPGLVFLLQVKCAMVSKQLGCPEMSLIVFAPQLEKK